MHSEGHKPLLIIELESRIDDVLAELEVLGQRVEKMLQECQALPGLQAKASANLPPPPATKAA